jgi:gas vesicle protein
MTDNAKQAWGEVGEKFTSWGRRVVDRYQESGSTSEENAEEKERQLKQAAKDLVDELSRGFSALGDTLRDDEAKKELTDAVSAIGDAITATVDETTGAIRRGSGSARPVPPRSDEAPESDESKPDDAT